MIVIDEKAVKRVQQKDVLTMRHGQPYEQIALLKKRYKDDPVIQELVCIIENDFTEFEYSQNLPYVDDDYE